MLLSLNKELDDGCPFWEIGKFDENLIAEQMAAVNEAIGEFLSTLNP